MRVGEINASGLASVPAGPALSTRLSRVELGSVPDTDLGSVLAAQGRQLAHQQAQLWATMAEIATRDPMPNAVPRWTPEQVFDSAADEIRAELLLTRRGALRELEHADAVVAQPRVFAALDRGDLDRARAIVLADACLDLRHEQAETLLDRLLPEAGRRTATGLAERVRKVAIALDPGWAERRYRNAVRERRVIGYLNEDGSATVSGQYLPAQQATAACDRVDALADLAKRAGAKASLDHVRAELFLGLLDGSLHNLSQDDIVAALCAKFPAEEATPDIEDGPALGTVRGVEVKVGLGTLLGVNDEPGEIAGWGPVIAPIAREIVAAQHGCQWRFAVVDGQGRLLFDGLTRQRPHELRDAVQSDGGAVELHVPAELLDDSGTRERHPAWAKLLADIAAQYAEHRPIEQDAAARFPGRRLRRRTQVSFQRCIFPGCRRPASDSDLDHRRDHARGGRTDEQNMAPGCRHDHMNKTRRGWRLIRIDEHTYRWITPLGRKHTVRIDPIAPPLPQPMPRKLRQLVLLPDFDEPRPTFAQLTRRGRPLKPAASESSDSDSESPPF